MESLKEALQVLESSPRVLSPAALVHIAQSVEYSLEGFPQPKGPLFQALIGRNVARLFLALGRMKHDPEAPVPGAPAISENVTYDEALQRLKSAVERFYKHEGAYKPHFAYGALDRTSYDRLQAYHVADHLRGR